MGTRTHVYLDHQIPDIRDKNDLLRRLTRTIPQAIAVDDYWESTEDGKQLQRPTEWRDATETCISFRGPGGLLIDFQEHTALIHATARWRGFLSIRELREAHLAAFRSIAAAVGATCMVYLPDYSEETLNQFLDGENLENMIEELEKNWGPAQPSVNDMTPEVVTLTAHTPPEVWYLEEIEPH